jgi:uncharacterized protein YdbL (DUF1318 family)
MSRLSLGDIDELTRLQRKILKRGALIDELLEHERKQYQGTSDEAFDGYVGSVRRRNALTELLDDITDAARSMGAILNRGADTP